MIKDLKQYWSIILTILLIVILVGMGRTQASFLGLSFKSGQKVAQQAVEFINKNMLQGQTAVLGDVKAVSDVYEFKMKIGEQEYTSYVTKDGKYLFTSGVDMSPATSTANNTPTTTEAAAAKQTCEDLIKTEAPVLEAFVVSKCPFGLQMQRILSEVVKSIPEVAKYIKVEYIGEVSGNKVTSMHGDEEAQENLRQVCIREEQANKYWDYIACHIKKGDIDSCLTQAGINQTQLNTCMTDTNKGLVYIKKDFERQDKFSVTGSPTLVLDDKTVSEFDFGGRTAEALKTVLCCGFNNQPSFCSQKLTTDQAATSFSETYGASGSASSGNCN